MWSILPISWDEQWHMSLPFPLVWMVFLYLAGKCCVLICGKWTCQTKKTWGKYDISSQFPDLLYMCSMPCVIPLHHLFPPSRHAASENVSFPGLRHWWDMPDFLCQWITLALWWNYTFSLPFSTYFLGGTPSNACCDRSECWRCQKTYYFWPFRHRKWSVTGVGNGGDL